MDFWLPQLRASALSPATPERYICASCCFHLSWSPVFRYNTFAGVVSPNLWLHNVALAAFGLWRHPAHAPCTGFRHNATRRRLRHEATQLVLFLALFAACVAAWLVVKAG